MANRVGQQIGRYRLLGLLGKGGFAEVYLGRHVFLKTHAAIKVLHVQVNREDLEHFLTEAQTIARLEHPNIVRVIDFGVEKGTPFLVMSYAPHGTVHTPLIPSSTPLVRRTNSPTLSYPLSFAHR